MLLSGLSTGAVLTSLTVTVMLTVCVSLILGRPLSVTRTVSEYVPGPCASLGVQEKMPLAALMLAPAGAPGSSEKRSVWAVSGSLAAAVKLITVISSPETLLIGFKIGGRLLVLIVLAVRGVKLVMK